MAEPLFNNRDLRRLFIPLFWEQGLEFLVGLTATLFISSVGEAAVSGVSLVDTLIMLLIAAFGALATGGAVVAGQFLGNSQHKDAQAAVRHLVWLALILSMGVMVLLYAATPWILDGLFGAITPEVRHHAFVYLMLVNASVPAIAVYAAAAAIFRTLGKTRVTMNVAVLMNISNIAVSALLVLGAHWDTLGVGIASLGSRLLAAVVMLTLASNDKLPLFFQKGGHLLDNLRGPIVRNILKIGLPFALENSLFHVGRILILSLVASFGTAAIAANAVGTAVAVFQILPGMAFGLGLTTVISRCVGSGNFDQARFYHRKILWWVYGTQLVVSVGILAALPALVGLYHLSQTAATLTVAVVIVHTIGANTIWPLSFTVPVTLRAAGDARFPMIVSLSTMAACRLVMAWILGTVIGWGLVGVWIAMTLDWLARALIFVPRYIGGRWQRFRITVSPPPSSEESPPPRPSGPGPDEPRPKTGS